MHAAPFVGAGLPAMQGALCVRGNRSDAIVSKLAPTGS